MSNRYKTIGLSELKVGVKIRTPIFDPNSENEVMFLSAGTEITQNQLDILRVRGITKVKVQLSELDRLTNSKSKKRKKRTSDETDIYDLNAKAFLKQIQDHGIDQYETAAVEQATQFFEGCVTQTQELFESLADGESVNGAAVIQATNANLAQMADDLDLFVSLGMKPSDEDSLYQHSVQTSRLAVAIGTTMQLDQTQLTELGIGCMVHDVGMMKVPKEIYESTKVLTPIEFLEITKHPIYTFEMIKEIKELPQGSRMVAYQLHERWNGSGYPRKRQGKQIHLLARIAGIADEFVAKISPRPYRPAMLAHFAMVEMVRGARNGMFDPEVIRALLHTLSLYPIGSFIKLSDGRVGKVIRSNGEDYANPVVEVRHPHQSPDEACVVDLTEEADGPALTIVSPLATLDERSITDPHTEERAVPQKAHGQLTFLCEGTYVCMSDGRIGYVATENPEMFSHPCVRVWSTESGPENSELIDLAEGDTGLHIECPIATPVLNTPTPETPEEVKQPKKQLSLFGTAEEDAQDDHAARDADMPYNDAPIEAKTLEPMLAGT